MYKSTNFLSSSSEDVFGWIDDPVDLSFPDRPVSATPSPPVQPHIPPPVPVQVLPVMRSAPSSRKSYSSSTHRRHLCDACGARFRERKNLVAHQDEVHMRRRKFSCQHYQCKVTSNRRFNIRRHERLMHGKPCRLACAKCRSNFQSNSHSNSNSVLDRRDRRRHPPQSTQSTQANSLNCIGNSHVHHGNNHSSNMNHIHMNHIPNPIVSQPVSFPSVPDWVEIDTLADVEEVQTLFDTIL